MKLVYKDTGVPVKVGDKCLTNDMKSVMVEYFYEPHPASSGKVTVSNTNSHRSESHNEYYVGVINAEWIDRSDQ